MIELKDPARPPPARRWLRHDERLYAIFESVSDCTDRLPAKQVIAEDRIQALFRHVVPPSIPFEITMKGERCGEAIWLCRTSILERAANLRENGINPTQCEAALAAMDARIAELRREAGLAAKIIEFCPTPRGLGH
jgi:hypothetical protein